MITTAAERTRSEGAIRAKARRLGYQIRKSRRRSTDLDNYGGYMIVNTDTNFIDAGVRYDLSLAEVEAWLYDPNGDEETSSEN